MKCFSLFLPIVFLFAGFSQASEGHDRRHRVDICHNNHEIRVDEHSVKAHMAHEDCLGECPCEAPEPECECDADCTDNLFCSGDDFCRDGVCHTLPRECRPTEVCDEDRDACVAVPECSEDCDCDNGLACDGAEFCVGGVCLEGQSPCQDQQVCDIEHDLCVPPPECLVDEDCSDNIFCNGYEQCVDGSCAVTFLPCLETEVCSEEFVYCTPVSGEGEGESSEGEGEPPCPSEGEGEVDPAEGEGEGESSEGEGEGEPSEGEGEPEQQEKLFISGSSAFTCQSSDGTSFAMFAMLTPFASLFSRRKKAIASAAVIAMIAMANPVKAEGLNRSVGAIIEHDTANVQSPLLLDAGTILVGGSLDYSHQPVVFRNEAFENKITAVEHQGTARLNLAFGLTDNLQIEGSVPASLTVGKGLDLTGRPSVGMADSLLGARLSLLEKGQPLQVAMSFQLGVPTSFASSNGQPILGESFLTGRPALLVSVGDDIVRATGNVGYTFRKEKSVADLTIGDEFDVGGALSVQLVPKALWVTADIASTLSSPSIRSSRMMFPTEASVGLRGVSGPLFASASVGTGLVADVGTPDVRATLAAGITFDFVERQVPASHCPPVVEPAEPTIAKPTDKPALDLVEITDDRIVILKPVFFYYDSSRIRPESIAVLMQVAEAMDQHQEILSLSVEGHTSSEGTSLYNLDLSQRRAAEVKSFLEAYGISPYRLRSMGFGEVVPIASNETQAGRESNRRVEFVILERKLLKQ